MKKHCFTDVGIVVHVDVVTVVAVSMERPGLFGNVVEIWFLEGCLKDVLLSRFDVFLMEALSRQAAQREVSSDS